EVSPMFGEMIGRFVSHERDRVGEPFVLAEVGAGSGSLLRPLLDQLEVEAWAVDASPPSRAALRLLLPSDRVVSDFEQLPAPFRGVIVCNELVDNLPMALATRQREDWRERWVDEDGGRLVFVDAPARPEVRDWLDLYAGPVEEEGWVEVQLAAGKWLEQALASITSGAVLVIDYGDTADGLLPRRRDGTLRTYRSHHLGPHPLDQPGATDITADVNFTALESVATAAGAEVELSRQDDFLVDLGLRKRLSELRKAQFDLAQSGDEEARLLARSQIVEAETLLHPRGLGDFRVLVARK
ncbi:MAG TPA: SAM-dependent methyltransferase, partial [Acidimicrobiia bacterium]